ncbi:MAG TPA: AI-2E family transporter [Gemmataceae bacterium]|nr:AI-2E family transporter [Gemmataceae bacterium]
MPVTSSANSWQRPLFIAGSLVLVVAALYLAKVVLLPVVLAILLTLVLSPVVGTLQRLGLGRIPSVIAVVVLAICLLGGVGLGVAVQLKNLASDLPQHKHEIEAKIERIRQAGGSSWIVDAYDTVMDISRKIHGIDTAAAGTSVKEPIPVIIETSPFPIVQSVAGPVIEVLLTTGMTLVLLIFMLVQREDLRNRLIRLWEGTGITSMTKAVDDAIHRISRYLLVQLAINTAFGTALAIGLSILGVSYPILWGFLAGTLRYIPYIGTWIGALLPIVLSIATQPGWTQPLLVLGLYLVLELITFNLVEPLLFGQSIGVSATALLIAAAFWAWLWGPVGLVIATPLTACLAVLGRYVRNLEFFSILLGDEPALEPHVTFYQRLLAKDPDEANEIVEEFIQTHSVDDVYDEILVPALVLARENREREESTAEEQHSILGMIRTLLDEVLTKQTPPSEEPAAIPNRAENNRVLVVGCPVRDETDELALSMFSQLVDARKCRFEVLSHQQLTAEVISRVEQEQSKVISVACVPPGGLARTRYLCKRLRTQFPDLKILVGCWGLETNVEQTRERLQAAGADKVSTRLLEMRRQITPLIQVLSHMQQPEERQADAAAPATTL